MPGKFYVVWQGRAPGVYASWSEARAQVDGFSGARYRAFDDRAQAEAAFAAGPDAGCHDLAHPQQLDRLPAKARRGYAVDAAWNTLTRTMVYRCVQIETGRGVFYGGPFRDATNNVGEFLAVVHGLAWLKHQGSQAPLYTDSRNAILWVSQAKCQTTLARTAHNGELFERIAQAERWLDENEYCNAVLKWRTELWGENPADFGRK